MKKNSELVVGDIIEVPVSHTDRVTSYVITRVTATQYVTASGLRFNKNLKVLGGRGNRNYDVYGQQPKAIEPIAEPIVATVTVDVTAETVVHTASKIATPESQPVIQEIPESQEVGEIVDKPIDRLPEHVQVCGYEINAPRKTAPFNALIGIEFAQDIVRFAKSGRYVYAPIQSIDESERYDGVSHYVLFSTVNRVIAKKTAWDDKTDLTEACRLVEIRKDESFVFEELDCEAVTYAATVDAQSITHPNGRWKIYFHGERPEDVVNNCSQFEFDGWDLNGDEYRIEFGFGNSDERIVWRIYAKDIVWDGKIRDLVCICRHPDALPEDDMGYKRPPVNPHSVPLLTIPWLENENENEEYEYAY